MNLQDQATKDSGRYVDLHCHGGGGYNFTDENLEHILTAIRFHKSHGTEKLIASLVTAEIGTLKSQIRRLAPLVQNGELAGIHLEGPYLAKARCGAHNPEFLRTPNLDELKSLIDIGSGAIKIITFAPELPGALEAINYVANQKIIAAIGHSDGKSSDARNALNSGASLVTHFTNAMSKLKDGEDTFATELLYKSDIPLEVILDGVHVNTDEFNEVLKVARERIILVTDAMSAAGQPDGNYLIGDLRVKVNNKVARLEKNGALAGSTLTMERAVKNAESFGMLEPDIQNSARELPESLLANKSL